jgi:hypothetical protein
MANMTEKSIVGDLINFRGLVYAPINENGVIFLFGKVADDLNMYIEEIKPGFPDCIGRRFIGKGWERVAIEFEYKSSNFKLHGHDPDLCDVIVCWDHDWKDCPIEVIELKAEIIEMKNSPVQRPGVTEYDENDVEEKIDAIIKNISASPTIKEWYKLIFEKIAQIDDNVWAKIGEKFIGWYSPERAFVSLEMRKSSIGIQCFSRGEPISGTKIANAKYSPRWVRFSVKSDSDIVEATRILSESLKRIKEAKSKGEQTSYFSGGEYAGGTNCTPPEKIEQQSPES